MPTTPPGYTPPPADLPQRGDRATFSNRVDAWVTWFSTVILTQLAAIAANVYANAVEAAASAASAMGYRDTALTYRDAAQAARDAAQGYRDTALTYRDQAAASATTAAASATAAANSAASIIATSPTDQTLGTGTFVFVTQAGKQFAVGADVKAVDQTNSGNAIYGTVAAYSGTSLTITGTSFTGSGVVSDWNISLSGQRGAQGPTGSLTGGNLTGALNGAKGADVASATTPDIWGGAGNYETVTGTATITGFTAAPQAGAHRRILAGGAFTLTAGANMVIKGVASGTSYTVAAGDEIDVYAETTTKFQVAITKGDGTAMAALYGAFQNTIRIPASGFFIAQKTGWHRVTLAGGSGRGAAVRNGASLGKASGAGAGGFCVGMRFLIAGQSYTVVFPSAVAAATTTTSPQSIQGISGNAASFSGSGIITMTANGGGGGVGATTDIVVAGGVGGTATGGDINIQGGSGGAIGTGGAGSASGGGSVGVQGVGNRGGNITPGNSSASRASGGAGVGGHGGDITGTVDAASGGGGAGGSAASVTAGIAAGLGGVNYAGAQSTAVAAFGDASALMNATAGGATAGTSSANAGAGSGGLVDASAGASLAGAFAGAGGNVNTVGAVTSGSGGAFGGAPGGAFSSSGNATTGAASAGLVQIEF